MGTKLSEDEKVLLLQHARLAIEYAVKGERLPRLDIQHLSTNLRENGASFVTLTKKTSGQLRGCIGTLTAYQPLIEDVRDHAIAAALEDYRFSPVQSHELAQLKIEISRLTKPVKVEYANPEELQKKISPHVDGVVIEDGKRRATFLPQVWEQIPEVDSFLTALCHKMGASGDLWLKKKLDVSIYQVEEFEE
ncbi:MAG: AMMECR1 domain-containing protein [Anaerolineaceae bacterium]|nr:AMMECR1 domain-containing protein [Anaerolineaceae bacterium]